LKSRKKIALIASDFPPFYSGYSFYNYNLFNKYIEKHNNIFLITSKNININKNNIITVNWKISSIFSILKFLRNNEINIINIQYPNILYGRYNIFPHLLVIILRLLKYDVITTIHEFLNIHFIRRLSEIVFFIFSQKVIVTSFFEKDVINKYLRISRKKINVIPIGSNVPIVKTGKNKNNSVIAYFGMFYPDKKIEEVINLFRQIELSEKSNIKFKMIGAAHQYYMKYLKKIIELGEKSIKNLEWKLNLTQEQLEKEFSNIDISVLFYNDGASLRRGSLLASIINGIPVITNKGKYINELKILEGKGIFYFDSNSIQNNRIIHELLNNPEFYKKCSVELKKYSYYFSFERVVKDYEKILEI